MANLSDVMDALSAAVSTIEGLYSHPYYADRLVPPCAIVGWPDELNFDTGMQRGSDQVVMPVTVAVGKADASSSRDRLAKYAAGSGAASVKAAIEQHLTAAWHSARVTKAEFGVITVGSAQYLSATFDVDIAVAGEE